MRKELILEVSPRDASESIFLKQVVAAKCRVGPEDITHIDILRKSVDARKRNIKINLSLLVYINEIPATPQKREFNYPVVTDKPRVIVAGAGPAGLFASLRLIELGYKPVIIERGKKVEDRIEDIELLERTNKLNPGSNYCFGEGGAGTFSDGKLYTRSKKRGDHKKVLEVLNYHGADDSILYEAHPHIGSDKLPSVIALIRQTILDSGGEIHFNATITDLIIENNKLTGIITDNSVSVRCKAFILATGHSARDIYYLLQHKNVFIEAKSFAMGVRVEHPQKLINKIQYHGNTSIYLPAASYNIAEQVGDRGVYSFCMCPGGKIVPAATSDGEIVVNGMSVSKRDSYFANSGLVVQVKPEDFSTKQGEDAIEALRLQSSLEQAAFSQVKNGQKAPAQRIIDFLQNKISSWLPDTSYQPGIISSPMHEWLPAFIVHSLQNGIRQINKKMKGFISEDAVMVGVESRTSSPVRIPRNADTRMHIHIEGLFPCGEGSGYAGGIISSAVDGEQTADKVALYLG